MSQAVPHLVTRIRIVRQPPAHYPRPFFEAGACNSKGCFHVKGSHFFFGGGGGNMRMGRSDFIQKVRWAYFFSVRKRSPRCLDNAFS